MGPVSDNIQDCKCRYGLAKYLDECKGQCCQHVELAGAAVVAASALAVAVATLLKTLTVSKGNGGCSCVIESRYFTSYCQGVYPVT